MYAATVQWQTPVAGAPQQSRARRADVGWRGASGRSYLQSVPRSTGRPCVVKREVGMGCARRGIEGELRKATQDSLDGIGVVNMAIAVWLHGSFHCEQLWI